MNLCQTSCCYSLLVKLTEYILNLAIKVILVDYLNLLISERRSLVLENLQDFTVFLRGYSLEGANVLASFEVYSSTRSAQVEDPLCNTSVDFLSHLHILFRGVLQTS